ncbi:hypothetical protein MY11210_008824 [Beauveria gryllotalpidicola]
MAEPAQPEASGGAPCTLTMRSSPIIIIHPLVTSKALASVTRTIAHIKQEHDLTGLEGLDFTLPPELTSSKRPYHVEGESHQEDSEAKRLKTEEDQATEQPEDDNSLEDGLALLVQNALSNVGDLVPQFNATSDGNSGDPMNIDAAALLESITPPPPTFFADPLKYVRNVQTHTLGNLSFTILYSLVHHQPIDDVLRALRDADSDHGRTFRRLQDSLESIWKLFTNNIIMSAEDISVDSNADTLLEMANLAKLCGWIVQGSAESYSMADSKLLAIFNCEVSDLPIDATELYLGIKTQNCIQQLISKADEQQAEQLVTQALTEGLGDKLKAQHQGDELHNADQAFIALATVRKDDLIAETKEKIDADALKKRYPADGLLRTFATYAKTRLAAVSDIGSAYGVQMHLEVDTLQSVTFGDLGGSAEIDLDDLSSFFEKTASGLVQDALAGLTEVEAAPLIVIDAPDNNDNATNSINDTNGTNGTNGINGTNGTDSADGTEKPAVTTGTGTGTTPATGKIDLMTDYKELEALVAESTSNYVKTTLNGLSPVPYQPTVPTSTTESMASQLPFLSHLNQQHGQHYYNYSQPMVQEPPPPQPVSGENLPPNQTCPSAMLYDKARQAALSKSSAHTRREGLHSTRRPWTQEEEKALMAGLDMVKGPHWSQILTLFGQNGTISDILKDRTQVQLKDKARNLKLFFLKTNSEMPYYLQAVTGELKTRAPTQAARKEAEERARMNSEEDQAKLQGIMALAGGLQHLPQGRAGAASVGSGVVTPAQAASAAQAAQGRGTPGLSNIPKTVAATIAQARQNSTQQTLQSMSQKNPPRPQGQAQLPPHVPRPQPQQAHHHLPQQPAQQPAEQRPHSMAPHQVPQSQQQLQQQQQQQQQPQQPQQPKPVVHLPQQPAVPPPHPIALPTTTSAQHSATHTPSATASPAPLHNSHPHTPVQQQTPQIAQDTPASAPMEPPEPEKPLSEEAQQEAENAAEAALLEGLQAAVAEALG